MPGPWAAPQLADDEWLAAWRVFLLGMNHRRDVLRARLGGLVIAAPPAVKVVAQRESPDLWSVRDLLIELAPRPMISSDRITEPIRSDEPRPASGARGLPYESDNAELTQEAQVLLAMPVAELAGPARERISRAVHRGNEQLAAVLLLAQSDGYHAAGDPAGALNLVQEGLTLDDVEPRTRERLLDSGVELAVSVSELELARQYAAELVALTERRASPDDPDAQRDLSLSFERLGDVTRALGGPAIAATHHQQALDIRRRLAEQLDTPQAQRDLSLSLDRLGNVAHDLGDPAAAATYYQQALDIDRRLAEQLGTARALQDLKAGLVDLARTEEELGNADAAAALRAELATVSDRLAALSDDPPPG
ncbi:MAG: tetratricopeptide repeat protein [Pseudonocardiaceae bacterium]